MQSALRGSDFGLLADFFQDEFYFISVKKLTNREVFMKFYHKNDNPTVKVFEI